jgi:hypothetical protein
VPHLTDGTSEVTSLRGCGALVAPGEAKGHGIGPLPDDYGRRILGMTQRTCGSWKRSEKALGRTVFFLVSFWLGPVTRVFAAAVPGEDQGGWLYAVTHLHPVTYGILFLIVVLSAVNLVVQGKSAPFQGPLRLVTRISAWLSNRSAGGLVLRGLKGVRLPRAQQRDGRHAPEARVPVRQPVVDEIGPVRRVSQTELDAASAAAPTPLDGVNHLLPVLAARPQSVSTSIGATESASEAKPVSQEFRFTSAVEIPSMEELGRREKLSLSVSGCVRTQDGKGIGAVIVFLTDEAGKRVGQSCRSADDTGEFRVLINQPGNYALAGYKRGYAMESSEPLVLPIESGKIEGFHFRMVEDGCVIRGRLVSDEQTVSPADYEVTCVCKRDQFSRAVTTDPDGEFRIVGVPSNSECFLEVRDRQTTLLLRSSVFETVQKRELVVDIALPHDERTRTSQPAGEPLPEGAAPASASELIPDETPPPEEQTIEPRGQVAGTPNSTEAA